MEYDQLATRRYSMGRLKTEEQKTKKHKVKLQLGERDGIQNRDIVNAIGSTNC